LQAFFSPASRKSPGPLEDGVAEAFTDSSSCCAQGLFAYRFPEIEEAQTLLSAPGVVSQSKEPGDFRFGTLLPRQSGLLMALFDPNETSALGVGIVAQKSCLRLLPSALDCARECLCSEFWEQR
jgi:hypothetical protein